MKIRYSSHISWQKYIDTIYVFNEKNNEIYLFKTTSLDIWEMIGNKNNLKDIIEYLSKEYECDYNELNEDCNAFVVELKENDLIDIEEE